MIPFFSVVIPVKNGARFLLDALDSVRAQTFRDFELLVVDDGSTDNTTALIEDFARSTSGNPVSLIRHATSRGPSGARNSGIARAKGQFVAFLDHDDVWLPEHLQLIYELIQKEGGELIYSPARCFDEDLRTELGFWGPESRDTAVLLSSLFSMNVIPPSTVAIKRVNLLGVGGFDESYCGPEDIECWFRLLTSGVIPRFQPEITCHRRDRADSLGKSMGADIYKGLVRCLESYFFCHDVALRTRVAGLRKRYAQTITGLKKARSRERYLWMLRAPLALGYFSFIGLMHRWFGPGRRPG